MLEQFLSAVYHPNRVIELMNSINLLYRIGLTSFTDRIDEILNSEEGIETQAIAANIEGCLEDGLVAGFNQFGVVIEYDHTQISIITDFLQFLAFWETEEGCSPESFSDIEDVNELGMTAEDVLIELFELSGGNHNDRMIDWIISVSPSLITRLNESFTHRPALTDEPASISVSALNEFRVYAVHYPYSKVVSYVKMGGAIGLSLNTLLLENDEWFVNSTHAATAQELVGLALISDMEREGLKDTLIKLVEPIIGSTSAGQSVVKEINAVFTKVMSK